MEKIKMRFVYEDVTKKGKLSKLTTDIIKLIRELEKTYDKEMFEFKSVEYSRFLSETKIKLDVNKNDLPVTIINEKVVFTKKLPSIDNLRKKIQEMEAKAKPCSCTG